MTGTTGELHARAKALGLKAAGAIEPIARAAFGASARSLGETGDRQAWNDLGSVHRRAWRSAVLAALEALLEPEPAQPTLKFGNGQPVGGLKPGDVVSVRGVVERVDPYDAGVSEVRLGAAPGRLAGMLTMIRNDDLTFIERPASPEPTGQLGDLAEDERGVRYSYAYPGSGYPWLVIGTPEDRPNGKRWNSRDEIPGPLHRLTVTRQDAP